MLLGVRKLQLAVRKRTWGSDVALDFFLPLLFLLFFFPLPSALTVGLLALAGEEARLAERAAEPSRSESRGNAVQDASCR